MAIDINDTRTMLQGLERSFPPTTLLRDTFFPKTQTFVTESVDMDYKKGSRRMSPFISSRDTSGVNVERTGHKTKSYTPPIMMPKRAITFDHISHRGFNEAVYSTRTPAQRAMQLRINDLAELRDMNTRRIEWMCAQLMLYGQIEVKGYADDGQTYLTDTITYDWTQKEILSGSDTWDNPTAAIYSDAKTVCQTIARNCGFNPTVMLFPYNVEDYILNNKQLKEWLDVRNMFIANIQPRIVVPGVRYIGYIAGLDLQLYAYDGIYQDDSGNIEQYIPDDYVIIGVTGRGTQLFGAITQKEANGNWITYEGRDVPKFWDGGDGKDIEMLRLGSRCVPKPESVDDWFVLKVK